MSTRLPLPGAVELSLLVIIMGCGALFRGRRLANAGEGFPLMRELLTLSTLGWAIVLGVVMAMASDRIPILKGLFGLLHPAASPYWIWGVLLVCYVLAAFTRMGFVFLGTKTVSSQKVKGPVKIETEV